MNTYHRLSPTISSRAGFSWVELLVVLVILVVLLAVLIQTITTGTPAPPANSMMHQGTQMYKAIFSKVLDDPNAGGELFPATTNGFTTST